MAYFAFVIFHNPIHGHYVLEAISDKGLRIGYVTMDVTYNIIPKIDWWDNRLAFKKHITLNIRMQNNEYSAYNGLHNLSGYNEGYFGNGYFFSGENNVVIKYDSTDGWQMAFGEFFDERFSLK